MIYDEIRPYLSSLRLRREWIPFATRLDPSGRDFADTTGPGKKSYSMPREERNGLHDDSAGHWNQNQ
ncbi:hypothetical protein JOH51_007547 [Rhizobium leguminosarum]|nr:hypothetical protein [Rhizobium leguminosarum]